MMLAGSPGSAQISIVMMAGTAAGRTSATAIRTAGRSHHRFTRVPAAYLPYFQESISVK